MKRIVPNPTHFLHYSTTEEGPPHTFTEFMHYISSRPHTREIIQRDFEQLQHGLELIDPHINISDELYGRVFGGESNLYGGCGVCSYYSTMFGSSTIKTEEDFERYKERFVTHMNKKHKDKIKKKLEKPNTNKKFSKVEKITENPCGDQDCPTCTEINEYINRPRMANG